MALHTTEGLTCDGPSQSTATIKFWIPTNIQEGTRSTIGGKEPTSSLVDWHKGIGRYQKGKEGKDRLHHGGNYRCYDKREECEPVMFDPFLALALPALAYAAWRFKKGRWDLRDLSWFKMKEYP